MQVSTYEIIRDKRDTDLRFYPPPSFVLLAQPDILEPTIAMSKVERDLLLSVNAGSSSLKLCLYRRLMDKGTSDEPLELIVTSAISSLTSPPATFTFKPEGSKDRDIVDQPVESITNHNSCFDHFLEVLSGEISIDKERIAYICHRVVHGGDYKAPVEITDKSYHHIERLSDLAPLHNGAALSVIKVCQSVLPSAKEVAYFDTVFHRTLPIHIKSYPIDQKIAKQRGLRKYGFHGLSYAFVVRAVAKFLQKPVEQLNLILLHLGSGASACAVQNGASFDTSMGLTPLNGLPGATRSGSIDPSLIFHYTNKAGRMSHDPSMAGNVHVTMAEDILNRKAGWKVLTGTTDFGVITSKAELDNSDPDIHLHNPNRLAFDIFLDRVLDYVGSYHLKLQGEVDAIVFSGGVGEKGLDLRRLIGQRAECLGYRRISPELNKKGGKTDDAVFDISEHRQEQPGVRAKRLLVCKTDEQLEMARECIRDDRFWH